jgi:molybdopterin synthase catalytic subunit
MVEKSSPFLSVTVSHADFDISELQRSLQQGNAAEGAIATFTGYVRSDPSSGNVSAMELEHYPGMTEKSIQAILLQATERWPILSAKVVHRVGKLLPGDQIVWVGVSSAHRAAAFSACEFIMDYLKADAPLWKKEHSAAGENWVEAKSSDSGRAARWGDEDAQ